MSLYALSLVLLSSDGAANVRLAQIQVIEQRAIIRVRPVASPEAAPQRTRWEEKKGPKCVSMGALAGALVSSPTSIDLLLRGGVRLRARLQKTCPSIDFYSGFYVRPTRDGRICEDRDLIHARTGGECGIDNFKSLVPGK